MIHSVAVPGTHHDAGQNHYWGQEDDCNVAPALFAFAYSDAHLLYSSKKATNSGKNDSNVGYLSLFASYIRSRLLSSFVQTNP